MSIPNRSSPLVPVHWPNVMSKGAANQSASKVQNQQHQKNEDKKTNGLYFKTWCLRPEFMEMIFIQSSFAFLVRNAIFFAVGRHVWKCRPKQGSDVTFDKDVRDKQEPDRVWRL